MLSGNKQTTLTRIFTNLALVIVSVVTTLILIETGLHFTPYRHLLERDRYIRYYYRADAAKGFDIRPNVDKIRTSVENHSVEF